MTYKYGHIISSESGFICGHCGADRERLMYFGTGDWRCVPSSGKPGTRGYSGCREIQRTFPAAMEKVIAITGTFRDRDQRWPTIGNIRGVRDCAMRLPIQVIAQESVDNHDNGLDLGDLDRILEQVLRKLNGE